MPKGYFMTEIEVLDWERYNKYRDRVWKTLADFGAQYVVRGDDNVKLVEGGEGRKVRTTVLEFPTPELVLDWYNCPEYREIREYRTGSTRTRAWAMRGAESPLLRPPKL